MSMYVQPASSAAWKIGGFSRGSQALRMTSASSMRARSTIACGFAASIAVAA